MASLSATAALGMISLLYRVADANVPPTPEAGEPAPEQAVRRTSSPPSTGRSPLPESPPVGQTPGTVPEHLPILMYHLIRTYDKPEDPVGQRLSVSPEAFTAQLDRIAKLGYRTLTFKDLENPAGVQSPSIILTFDDGYRNFYTQAYPEIVKRRMKAVAFIVTNYVGSRGFVSEKEIREMAAHGIEIGSHTLSHPGLKGLSPEKQKKEIEESKKVLERMLGQPVISFCYPFGDYDATAVAYVEAAGYRYAVTTPPHQAKTHSRFLIPRTRAGNELQMDRFLKGMGITAKLNHSRNR